MSNHPISKISVLATLALAILFPGIPVRSATGERNWSIDLRDYWGMEANSTAVRSNRPIICLAATNSVIGVALGIPDAPRNEDECAKLYGGQWNVMLLLFDANSGKLTKKSGPWSGGPSFELHPTRRGNFLLFLRHFHSQSQNPGETLRLLSSSGEEPKKMDLPESTTASRRGWSEIKVSPGGHTVVLGQIREGNVHYRVLEADTLETQFEWT